MKKGLYHNSEYNVICFGMIPKKIKKRGKKAAYLDYCRRLELEVRPDRQVEMGVNFVGEVDGHGEFDG